MRKLFFAFLCSVLLLTAPACNSDTVQLTAPTPASLVAPDTAGFVPMMSFGFDFTGDRGAGPVRFTPTWTGNLKSVTDSVTGQTFGRFTYTIGHPAGSSPGFVWSEQPGTQAVGATTVYSRGLWRYSTNFVNPSSNVSKTYLLGFGANGNQLIVGLDAQYKWKLSFQGVGSLPTGASVGLFTHNPADCCNFEVHGALRMQRGTWDKVETLVFSGAYGTHTSRAQLWVRDTLVADVSGFDIVAAGLNPALFYWKDAPVWGGGGSPVTQLMTLDHDSLVVLRK